MRKTIWGAVLTAAMLTPAVADTWRSLSGPAIDMALTDQVLEYDGAWQRFYASGRTLYNAGHDSWGYWAVRGDHYCSQWPPGDLWTCYDMAAKGNKVRFVGASGDITIGVFRGE